MEGGRERKINKYTRVVTLHITITYVLVVWMIHSSLRWRTNFMRFQNPFGIHIDRWDRFSMRSNMQKKVWADYTLCEELRLLRDVKKALYIFFKKRGTNLNIGSIKCPIQDISLLPFFRNRHFRTISRLSLDFFQLFLYGNNLFHSEYKIFTDLMTLCL